MQHPQQAEAQVVLPAVRVDDDVVMAPQGDAVDREVAPGQVLLGCENPFLIPEDPPYVRGAHAVHEQGGVLVYVHPVRYYPGKQYNGEWLDFPGNNLARELIFDACAGPSFDGLSVLSDEPAHPDAHRLWFNLLNRGCCVPVFADSDACFDRPTLGLKAPGFWTTWFYVRPGTPVTEQALVEAVRRGQGRRRHRP